MSEEIKWDKIGNEIRSAVQNSIQTGDFSQLGGTVSDTVTAVVNEARRQAAAAKDNYAAAKDRQTSEKDHDTAAKEKSAPVKDSHAAENNYNYGYVNRSWGPRYTNVPSKEENRNSVAVRRASSALMKKSGNVAGVLYIVFGSIGVGCVGIALFVLLILTLVIQSVGLYITDGILLIFLIVFICMLRSGCSLRGRLKRARRYLELCNGKMYINIADLARHCGQSVKYVLKDIKNILRAGIYPEGHLDAKGQCLMLDDATYREYLKVEQERQYQQEQTADGERASGTSDPTEEPEEDPKLAAMIRQGNDCILRLRNMNDEIEGEVISAKLFTLENVLREIFDRVQSHPEQMPKMQKFMDYYLPTTLKLVEAYKEFDSVSSPGEEIVTAKREIEKTLDTINESFEELRNQLFLDSVFDATTDAQVLKTMLAKEGLAREKVFEPRR